MPSALAATRGNRSCRAEERRLREGILHLGALLGWDAPTVAQFAAAVTGHTWRSCGRTDLQGVVEAYALLAHRVRAVQARLPGAVGANRETV
jgi:hypothetical protein